MNLGKKTDKTSMFQYSNTEPENSINDNNQPSIFDRRSSILSHKSQAGFTLIEIGIAIFILAIGLISMLTLFPIGVDSIKKVTQYSNTAILSEIAISDLIANKDYILGTMTAGVSYVYPDNDKDMTKQFEDSSTNSISDQYSWQAILKNISTTDKNLVRAQIAIFRNFNSSQFGTGTATFAQDNTDILYASTLPSGLTSKDYLREDNDKFWYRIDSIGTSTLTITLEGPFLGAGGTDLTFSTTDDIIDIYETMFARH